jgi:hypothetical protein
MTNRVITITRGVTVLYTCVDCGVSRGNPRYLYGWIGPNASWVYQMRMDAVLSDGDADDIAVKAHRMMSLLRDGG